METTPTLLGFITFCRQIVGIPQVVMGDEDPAFPTALQYAQLWIPTELQLFAPELYVAAVYNWAASYLIQFKQDPTGQVFFTNARSAFGITNFVPGVINSAHNEATSQTMTIGKGLQNMTLTDLQRVKDPYGRSALAILQDLGTLWGLT
jgi:hypothetical protein